MNTMGRLGDADDNRRTDWPVYDLEVESKYRRRQAEDKVQAEQEAEAAKQQAEPEAGSKPQKRSLLESAKERIHKKKKSCWP